MKKIIEKFITKKSEYDKRALAVRANESAKIIDADQLMRVQASKDEETLALVEEKFLYKKILTQLVKGPNGEYIEIQEEYKPSRIKWLFTIGLVLGILFGTFNLMSIPARAKSAITLSKDISERNRQILLQLENSFGEELTHKLLSDDLGLKCIPKEGGLNCEPNKPVVNTEEKK